MDFNNSEFFEIEHVLRPLGDDKARVAVFMDILKATVKEYLTVQKK